MFTKAVILLATLYAQEVLSSHYHGPIAIPHVLHDGHIADTHEVAAAKSEHFAAVAKAKAHGGYGGAYSYGGDYGYSHGYGHSNSHGGHGDFRYHGPTAIPHVLHDGHIADTHEVAAAKSEHFAAVAKAKAHGGYGGAYSYGGDYGYSHGYGHSNSHGGHGDFRYHGPTAIPHVLHDGHIADTHEVAAAKAEHFAAVAKAKAHGGYGGAYSYGGDYGYSHGYGHSNSYGGHGDFRYHGPTAIPHVLHDGHIADTHEVAAAKAEHFAAVAKAHYHGGSDHGYSGRYADGYGSEFGAYHGHSYHAVPYHGPLAKPVVLHTGYLADTHEVAVAKQHHLQSLYSSHHDHYNQHY